MDDPVAEIPHIIRTLCTGPAAIQSATIKTYFTPTASFTHPFCRTGSFAGSIWLIIMIYRWYKILSPHIDVFVDSVAFDKKKLLLYVSIHQNFRLWVVPFYIAPVQFVTVLQLTTDPFPQPPDDSAPATEPSSSAAGQGPNRKNNGRRRSIKFEDGKKRKSAKVDSSDSVKEADGGTADDTKYYIQSQDDLYQTSEWIKFLVPWGIGAFLVVLWQFWATIFCVIGTMLFDLIMWLPRRLYYSDFEFFENNDKKVLGPD